MDESVTPGFKDHFSAQSNLYAQFRPTYPAELFEFLASLTHSHSRAWDCATGSGQAALSLVPFFEKVVGTDASQRQIDQAVTHPKIKYFVTAAESCPILLDRSVDLVTVASGIHWFDFERFYSEVRRVLKPSGVIAAWVFHQTDGVGPFDQLIEKFQHEVVGPYFPEETKKWVWTDYKTIPFPFNEIAAPEFRIKVKWTTEETLGYLGTWSATQRYIAQNKSNPLDIIEEDLRAIVSDAGGVIERSWKLCLRVGKWEG